MTLVSLTEAAARLGIDARTLHRWLGEAQLALHHHPQDARKKGVSAEHLEVLARLHQRRLAPLSQEPPAPASSMVPALPAQLLALPEQVCALQTQIAALQQQLADLTRLLEPQTHPPVSSPALPRPKRRASQPVQQAPRSRAAATTPARPVHVIPRVEYAEEGHYVVICPKKGRLPFEADTPEWFAWVAEQESFRFVGKMGHFTAHHEWRIPKGAWRAYRKIRNRNHILRLAPNHELTSAVLEQVAETLQAQLQ